MLTKKQAELIHFIHDMLNQEGLTPSFEEMRKALKLKSKSGIHRLILALEERGFIRRLPHRARALEVLRLPESLVLNRASGHESSEGQGLGARRGEEQIPDFFDDRVRLPQGAIPIMGRIAAGTPIVALQHVTHTLSIPQNVLSAGEHFGLEVQGDSMKEAGIMDHDVVVIRKQSTAENGDIVVALIDEEEATLKKFHQNGADISLEPANSAYETRVLPKDRVRVQGKLVFLYRKY